MGPLELPVLIAVLDTGSIQAAARTLGISRPTVRRRLEQLEASVGVKLVIRDAGGIQPTEAGAMIAARAREMLDELAVLSRAARQGSEPRGALRVAVPPGAPGLVGRDMHRFVASTWPDVTLCLVSAEVPYDALLETVDCMITLRLDDPGPRFASFELATVREQFFTTEAYLAARGPIESLEALGDHPLVAWFTCDLGPPRGLPVAGRTIDWRFVFCADAMPLLTSWVPEAIALAPFAPQVAAMAGLPPLVPVLPDLVGRDRPLRMIVAKALVNTPLVKSFVEATRAAATAFAGLVAP